MKTQVLKAALMIIITATTLTSFSQSFSGTESQNSNTSLTSNPGYKSMVKPNATLPYPNPAKDAIFLPPGSNPYLVYIYDENGNLIKIIDIRMSDNLGEIDLKELTNGIYFMKIVPERGDVAVHRFTVLK